MNLQRSESLVEVYKKKVENFEDMRQQLIDSSELNRKL